MQITKRNGRVVLFDNDKIAYSIMNASADAPEEFLPGSMALGMADEVLQRATSESDIITTADIRRHVIELLRERGLYKTAENYKTYGEKK